MREEKDIERGKRNECKWEREKESGSEKVEENVESRRIVIF